jgi:hypothetical protein
MTMDLDRRIGILRRSELAILDSSMVAGEEEAAANQDCGRTVRSACHTVAQI